MGQIFFCQNLSSISYEANTLTNRIYGFLKKFLKSLKSYGRIIEAVNVSGIKFTHVWTLEEFVYVYNISREILLKLFFTFSLLFVIVAVFCKYFIFYFQYTNMTFVHCEHNWRF